MMMMVIIIIIIIIISTDMPQFFFNFTLSFQMFVDYM